MKSSQLKEKSAGNSAPYLKLKNSQRTPKCQVFFYSARKTQNLSPTGKLKWGTLSDFLTSSIVAEHQRRAFGEFFSEKSLTMPKETERGDPLVSLVPLLCYAEKQEKTFWSSWLGEMVQFDTIIFRRTS